MKRTIIPLLLLGIFAIGGSQLPSVTAQLRTTASSPLPGPALSNPYSELQNPLSTPVLPHRCGRMAWLRSRYSRMARWLLQWRHSRHSFSREWRTFDHAIHASPN